jgi:hypothetical protein
MLYQLFCSFLQSAEAQPNMTRSKRDLPVADKAPSGDVVTPYDKDHLVTYLRLLDAAAEGAEWTDVAQIVLGLDPTRAGARATWESHLMRAKWLSKSGYEQLVRNDD